MSVGGETKKCIKKDKDVPQQSATQSGVGCLGSPGRRRRTKKRVWQMMLVQISRKEGQYGWNRFRDVSRSPEV